MIHLTKENLDDLICASNAIVVCFYQKNHALCTFTMNSFREIEKMAGRSFQMYMVDVDAETEVCNAFGCKITPECVSVMNGRIYKRASGMLLASQILDLLK